MENSKTSETGATVHKFGHPCTDAGKEKSGARLKSETIGKWETIGK